MTNERVRRTPLPDFRNKLKRALWQLAWLVACRPAPIQFHAWRVMVSRAFGARIARGTRLYPDVRIWAPWNLTMEPASCVGPGVECYNVGQVVLRTGATVSQRAFLCTASHDPHDRAFALVVGPIEIGPGAWVAAEAFIGPGVVVAKDALVAARAVVVRGVPANAIVAGNPARMVGQRYADERASNDRPEGFDISKHDEFIDSLPPVSDLTTTAGA